MKSEAGVLPRKARGSIGLDGKSRRLVSESLVLTDGASIVENESVASGGKSAVVAGELLGVANDSIALANDSLGGSGESLPVDNESIDVSRESLGVISDP